jgi:DNA-binding MarR family transcriptional regulator
MGRKARERERERGRDKASRDPVALAARVDSVAVQLQRRLGREVARDGLTDARFSTLSVLVSRGPHTLGALARAEGVRPPAMTRLVSAMGADGLVERVPDPHDGRRVFIHATSQGFALHERAREHRVAPLAGLLRGCTRRDLRRLDSAFDLLESFLLGRDT